MSTSESYGSCSKAQIRGLKIEKASKQHLCSPQSVVLSIHSDLKQEQIAEAISKRMEMLVISMGSGKGCDAQYLFAEDILGTNRGHVPRHAKVYRNLAGELDRIQRERVQAFREYQADVLKGTFPDTKNTVSVKSEEYDEFLRKLPPI